MDQEEVTALKLRQADQGYKITFVLFWGWLLAGLFNPFNNVNIWYAIFTLFGAANALFVFRRAHLKGAWNLLDII